MAMRNEFGCFTSEFDGFMDEQVNLPTCGQEGAMLRKAWLLGCLSCQKQAKILQRDVLSAFLNYLLDL